MKRLIAIAFVLALLMSLGISGCNSNSNQNAPSTGTTQQDAGSNNTGSNNAGSDNAGSNNTGGGNTSDNTQSSSGDKAPLRPSAIPPGSEQIDKSFFTKTWDLDPSVLGTYEFSFSMQDPSTALKTLFLVEWSEMIYEATNGGVDITVFANGTLATASEVLPATLMGVADIGWVPCNSFVTQTPITSLFGLAAMGLDANTLSTEVIWDMLENPKWTHAFEPELEGLKLLLFTTNGKNCLGLDKPVSTLEGMKGIRIRALGGIGIDFTTLLGAAPVSMPPADIYDAVSKGVLDGYVFDWGGIESLRLYELTDYYNLRSFYTSPTMIVMNENSWNQLPAEYQEVIEYYSGRDMSLQYAHSWEVSIINAAETYATPDQFNDFADEEWQKVLDIAEVYNMGRIEAINSDTIDGYQFYADLKSTIQKYYDEDYLYYRFK